MNRKRSRRGKGGRKSGALWKSNKVEEGRSGKRRGRIGREWERLEEEKKRKGQQERGGKKPQSPTPRECCVVPGSNRKEGKIFLSLPKNTSMKLGVLP